MPAFKRFGPGDQIDNVLVLEPLWTLSSGTGGWSGAPEGSASVSLYGGYNRKPAGVVREYRFQRTIQGTDSFGILARSEPITASVNFVWMTDESLNLTQRSSTRWGHEHWKTVQRLYADYKRRDPDYVTSSYDHYVLYFQRDSRNVVAASGNVAQTTGSFTIESWVKPLLTSSATNDFTVQSCNNVFWLGITGSNGRLAFSSSYGIVTASQGPTRGEWSHVAVAYDSTTLSGIFYLNLQNVGTFTMSPLTASVATSLHSIGNRLDGYGASAEGSWSTGSLRRSFHGFIGESRVWRTYRSYAQLSSSHNHRLTGSELGTAQMVFWFNEGPLSRPTASLTLGSGALDQAQLSASAPFPFANLRGFDDRLGPVWHPSDNTLFYIPKRFASGSEDVSRMLGITVPAGMYGRRMVPESISITCRGYDSPTYGLVRTLIDDGRGGLYLSGSVASGSAGAESVGWNKVGNVFYDEGLVVIRDPSLLDFAGTWMGVSENPSNLLQLSFRSESRIPVKTLMCRIDRGDLNASLNPTFYRTEEDGDRIPRHPSGSVYVTTVGIYNSDRELVGVARFAEPLRVRPRDRMNVKLRMDF